MGCEVPLTSFNCASLFKGFPGGSDGKELAMQETWVRSLGQEEPLEKGMSTHFSILGLPRILRGKESTCQAEDARGLGSIPGLGRYPGGRSFGFVGLIPG